MVLLENYAAHTQRWLECFNDSRMSDVILEAKDGQIFHCHTLVLAVSSPHFEKLFFTGERGGPRRFVEAKDVEPGALKWILRACYTGDGNVNDENVVNVMVAAGLYGLKWAEKGCMEYMEEHKSAPSATFEYSKENEKWQEWTVPQTGWYHIVAIGAKSADAPKPDAQLYKAKGGLGAIVGASFQLQAGDVIRILTGGMSRLWVNAKYPNHFTGGGGGTFVALKNKEALSLLLAAGGGGSIRKKQYGTDANLGEDGIGANPKCLGGKNGGNGQSNGSSIGGLGWKAGPVALAKPRTSADNDNGGFGGGGAAGGGGGGYSGGSAQYLDAGGGGGGSYIAPKAMNTWMRVGSFGHGKVYIWSGEKIPVKENFFMKQLGGTSEKVPAKGNTSQTDDGQFCRQPEEKEKRPHGSFFQKSAKAFFKLKLRIGHLKRRTHK